MTSSTGGLIAEIKRSVATGRLTVIILVVGTLAGLTMALLKLGDATDRATTAGDRADKAAACSQLLLGSIADRALRPEATDRGCDTSIATDIIRRGIARDTALAEAMSEADTAQRERDLLRGQLLGLGQQPLTEAGGGTVVVPGSSTTVVPAPSSATPAPAATPTAAPSSTPAQPSPTTTAQPGVVCGLLRPLLSC